MGVRVLGVIPARLTSHRLARKVVRPLLGVPLVVRVYEAVRDCALLDAVLVATDSDEVRSVCARYDVPAELTRADHRSGTDRVWEVANRLRPDIVVNIQGDEPFVTAAHIERLVQPLLHGSYERVTTLRYPLDRTAATDPNVVKVVTDRYGRALYFSRAPVPFDRDGTASNVWFKHLGFYAYRTEALALFHRLPPGRLEQVEKLEQLRLLEHGVTIRVLDAPADTLGVDTEEDFQRAERLLAEQLRREQAA